MFRLNNNKDFDNALKNKDLNGALLSVINGFEPNKKQTLKLFELTEFNNIFEIMDSLIKGGNKIPDKYLILSSIYLSSTYWWDVGVGTERKEYEIKYPYLTNLYEKKLNDSKYNRLLFEEWKNLFNEMIEDKTIYKDQKHKSTFYYWAHDYEEFVIEKTAFMFEKKMFKEVTNEELLKIIINCKNYPKIPHKGDKDEFLYNRQNSRYYDVQCFAKWLSSKIAPNVNNNKEFSVAIPLVSQGVINEINLYYKEIVSNKLLDAKDDLLFKKLYEQRLPELLNQYEIVKDKNITKFKDGKSKNADDFLYESLLEIRSIFNEFSDKINLKKIENLSLNVRVTKEFIKHSF